MQKKWGPKWRVLIFFEPTKSANNGGCDLCRLIFVHGQRYLILSKTFQIAVSATGKQASRQYAVCTNLLAGTPWLQWPMSDHDWQMHTMRGPVQISCYEKHKKWLCPKHLKFTFLREHCCPRRLVWPWLAMCGSKICPNWTMNMSISC